MKYSVTIPVYAFISFEVEAEDEWEAVENANVELAD